ncbi:MAG: hypothetical protein ACOXZR_02300 [Bacilli bacterium]|jgi:hypothetical protein
MSKKVNLILAFVSLTICLGLMSGTYSRYVVDATSNIEVPLAKWQILINNTDITNDSQSELTLIPIIEENIHVAPDVLAPSSTGYIDIDIDPSNVEVSFLYKIKLELENEEIPDLKITNYALYDESFNEENDELELLEIDEEEITNTMFYNKEEEEFYFQPFTIRIYFEWYEGEEELMDDEMDSEIGFLATDEDLTFLISASISFTQIIE